MTTHQATAPSAVQLDRLKAAIFDVDGVLLASPHERAWREALRGYAEPDRFTTAMYQADVAGKPRLSGARAALEALGVPDAERQAIPYAERKQKRLEELLEEGSIAAFPDALRFVLAMAALGWPMAVASSSKNASGMMRSIRLDSGKASSTSSEPMSAGAIYRGASPTRRFSCWRPRNCTSNPRIASSPRMPLPASRRHVRAT